MKRSFKIKGGENMNRFLDKFFMLILVIGGINWGLVGIANLDLVNKFLGFSLTLTKIVYILVGISGIYGLTRLFKPTYY